MRTIIFAILFLTGLTIFISCKKETRVSNPPSLPTVVVNKAPVANASSDIIISLPTFDFWLEGKASYDPDGIITSYLWSQISGPFFYKYTLSDKLTATTHAMIHIGGTYQFQLTVTDNNGLTSQDTVVVIVKDYTNPQHLVGQDVVFNNLTWVEQQEDYFGTIINYVSLKTPSRPDLFPNEYIKVEVWLQPHISELSCENCIEGNKPPTANAGIDQIITIPKDRKILDGSASTDADGKITEWLWTKISGPASYSIVNATAAKTRNKNPKTIAYQFELKVMDDGGLPEQKTGKKIFFICVSSSLLRKTIHV